MADIGIKLAVEGEKEFKRALSDINSEMKVLGSEMKLVDAQFSSNDKSAEALTARNKALGDSIVGQEKKVETLRDALKNASDSFGENDKRTQEWQTKLNLAEAELVKMNRQLDENETALRDVERGYNDAGEEVDEFGNVVEDAGSETEDAGKKAKESSGAFSALGNVAKAAAAAVAAAFAAVGTAAIGASKALTQMSVDGAAYADDLLTQSIITGISTDKLQEYQYASELADVSLETLTGSMAKNIKSMSSAANGSKNVAEAYQKLGVEVTNADGSLRDSDEVYWELIDALGMVENETERDALAMTVLGKSAQTLNPLIDITSEGMAELGEKAYDAGYVLSNETLNRFGTFDNKIQELKTGATAAKNALGTVLLPALTDLAGTGVDLLGQFAQGVNAANGDINAIGDVVSSIIPQAVDVINQYVPVLLGMIGSTISAIGKTILNNLPSIVESANGIITSVIDSITEALPGILDAGTQILMTLGMAIIDNAPMLIEAGIQIITTLVTSVSGNLPRIIEAAIGILNSLLSGLATNLPIIIPAIVDGVILIAKTLTDPENLKSILRAALELIKALAQGLLDALPDLIAAVPEIIDSLVDFLTDPETLGMLVETGITLLIAVNKGLIEAIPRLLEAIPEIIGRLVEGFGDQLSNMKDIGLNLIRGLWEGIKDAGAWLRDKISGFFGGVVDSIKDFFGIASPSKLMKNDVGKNLALGIGEGFEDQMEQVSRDMTGAIPTSFDAEVNASTRFGSAGAATGGIDLVASTPIQLILDGRVLTETVVKHQLRAARAIG